jgi:hypothetical protein
MCREGSSVLILIIYHVQYEYRYLTICSMIQEDLALVVRVGVFLVGRCCVGISRYVPSVLMNVYLFVTVITCNNNARSIEHQRKKNFTATTVQICVLHVPCVPATDRTILC